MPPSRVQRVQDSVHGLMEFRGMETLVIEVLRTPELQRLRRVRQLGLVHLVFPGGEHTRLVHSLGAAHLAVRFGRQLRDVAADRFSRFLVPDEVAVRDFALAALFHDLGHGPLSHAWEREIIGEEYDEARWRARLGLPAADAGGRRLKWHVLVGQALLARPDGELHRLLEMHERGSSERLQAFLRGRYHIPYLPRLLDSDVDVDRADFIRRDGLHCGVKYGGYDLDWLISTCGVGRTAGGELVAGFDQAKALRVVEQFLTARRAMYETVYHHKTVRAAEGMVSLFLRRLREVAAGAGAPRLADRTVQPLLAMAAGEVVGPEELLRADDFALQVLIDFVAHDEAADPVVRDLARRIVARDLFKLVPVAPQKVNDFLRQDGGTDRIYEALRRHFDEPRYYLIKDFPRFGMLADKEAEWGYFVNARGDATPIREHEGIRPLWREAQESARLFAPREVVDDLARLIG